MLRTDYVKRKLDETTADALESAIANLAKFPKMSYRIDGEIRDVNHGIMYVIEALKLFEVDGLPNRTTILRTSYAARYFATVERLIPSVPWYLKPSEQKKPAVREGPRLVSTRPRKKMVLA